MQHLNREISLKQAAVLQARQRLVTDSHALQQQALAALATPQALAGSFGLGLLLALLLGGSRRGAEGKAKGAPPGWLRLLLRDVAMPLALGALQARGAADQQSL